MDNGIIVFASFNIIAVLGHGFDEMVAVHLMKIYCLPVSLYGCEIWQILASERHIIKDSLNKSIRQILLNQFCFIVTTGFIFY